MGPRAIPKGEGGKFHSDPNDPNDPNNSDHADTLVGEAVMMVAGELTLEQVGRAIHPHPTQTELFGKLARRLHSRLSRSKKKGEGLVAGT